MNCWPAPLPTFLAPAGSKAGPPLAGLVEAALVPEAAAAWAVLAGMMLTAAAALELAAPPVETNPQPVLPFCVEAPGPEQIPVGLAQQPLWQSALLKHWPPMNWVPTPLPTFLAPAGSNGGTAATRREKLKRVAIVTAFIFATVGRARRLKSNNC